MSLEGNAITEYASLSGKIHTLVIDKTLSISGAAADAKATGDAVDRLEAISEDAKENYEAAKAAYDETVGSMSDIAREVAEEVAKEEVSKLTAGDVDAYTKEETLSADTKTLLGLGADDTPDDVFKKVWDNGVPKVGDTLTTTRTDLGDNWLLCNGDINNADAYPELNELLPAYNECHPNNKTQLYYYMNASEQRCRGAYGDGLFFIPYYTNSSSTGLMVLDATTGAVLRKVTKYGDYMAASGYFACAYHDGVLCLAFRNAGNATLYYAISRDNGETFVVSSLTTASSARLTIAVWSPNDNAFVVMPGTSTATYYDVVLIYPETHTAAAGQVTGMGYNSDYGDIYMALHVLPDGTLVMLENAIEISSNRYYSKARLTYRTNGLGAYSFEDVFTARTGVSTTGYSFMYTLDWDEKNELLYLFSGGTDGTEVYTLSSDGTKTLKTTLTNYAEVTALYRLDIVCGGCRVFDDVIMLRRNASNTAYLYKLETGEYIGALTIQDYYSNTHQCYYRHFINTPSVFVNGCYTYVCYVYCYYSDTSENSFALRKFGKQLPTVSVENAYTYIKAKED